MWDFERPGLSLLRCAVAFIVSHVAALILGLPVEVVLVAVPVVRQEKARFDLSGLVGSTGARIMAGSQVQNDFVEPAAYLAYTNSS